MIVLVGKAVPGLGESVTVSTQLTVCQDRRGAHVGSEVQLSTFENELQSLTKGLLILHLENLVCAAADDSLGGLTLRATPLLLASLS